MLLRFLIVTLCVSYVALVSASLIPLRASSNQLTIGNVRVTALSKSLVRVEPKGPLGFEDRTTFSIVGRASFEGVSLTLVSHSGDTVVLSTDYYNVSITQRAPLVNQCSSTVTGDVADPVRSPTFPSGVKASGQQDCCSKCQSDKFCRAWVYNTDATSDYNCWPLSSFTATKDASNRTLGCADPSGCVSALSDVTVTAKDGSVLFEQKNGPVVNQNKLYLPSPLTSKSFALTDYPRFYAPPWGPTPIPANVTVDPALVPTNGYDYRNNVNGDTYVFLMGSTLEDYYHSRSELLKLVGPCPMIPDYAFGTWFTWWTPYNETWAKDDISHWTYNNLPIDIWGLDMNWRETDNKEDRSYNYPNTSLFSNLSEWFAYLKGLKLRTYFNDHPFPVADQTTAKEVAFRWEGLSKYMNQGLDFWWFDHNWGFSIPPPNTQPVNGWDVSRTDGVWCGLDNAAWGTHLYFSTVARLTASASVDANRPLTLTKFGLPDWNTDRSAVEAAESPAQHRYPVWWTGDGVTLQASVQSMVDAGVYHLKPYVHSDCGGDYRGTGGDLLRWTAHCTFGTIFRYHGDDHRPWTYDDHTLQIIKSYLNLRYRLMPTLIAAGHTSAAMGFPIVARCDLFWPQYPQARSNDQYIHAHDTLVAPIFSSSQNVTSRSVWIPEGQWQDVWSGIVASGPTVIESSQPFERQPMWHRRGGLVVMVDNAGVRVDDQDWSKLTLQAYPDFSAAKVTRRAVFSQSQKASVASDALFTGLQMTTSPTTSTTGTVTMEVTASSDGVSRAWTLRLHLLSNTQRVKVVTVDGSAANVTHIPAADASALQSPAGFGVVGTAPAVGVVAEVEISASNRARYITLTVTDN